jgi:hypothetical protein
LTNKYISNFPSVLKTTGYIFGIVYHVMLEDFLGVVYSSTNF